MISFKYLNNAYVHKQFEKLETFTALRERRCDGFVGCRVPDKVFMYNINGLYSISQPKHMKQINNKKRKSIKNDII